MSKKMKKDKKTESRNEIKQTQVNEEINRISRNKKQRLIVGIISIVIISTIVIGYRFIDWKIVKQENDSISTTSELNIVKQSRDKQNIKSFDILLNLSNDELSKINIAEINLICATGLFGAENLDIPACLNTLDEWSDFVHKETDRQMYKFYRNPMDFNNSINYFKVLLMVTALQRDLGAKYNMDIINSGAMNDVRSTRFFRDSKDLFLHGFFSSSRSGSCASMPVLMVAVGRKLGYPLKLVTTKGHLFSRWEDSKEVFNIETAGRGLNVFPDSHYYKWPFPISDNEIQTEGYLKSLSPLEELGGFLEVRAMCLQENGKYDEALKAFKKAYEIKPKSALLPLYINSA